MYASLWNLALFRTPDTSVSHLRQPSPLHYWRVELEGDQQGGILPSSWYIELTWLSALLKYRLLLIDSKAIPFLGLCMFEVERRQIKGTIVCRITNGEFRHSEGKLMMMMTMTIMIVKKWECVWCNRIRFRQECKDIVVGIWKKKGSYNA